MLLSKKALRDEAHGRHTHESNDVFLSLAFLLNLPQNGHRIRGSRRHVVQQVVFAELSHVWEEEAELKRQMEILEAQMREDMKKQEEEDWEMYDPYYEFELDFPQDGGYYFVCLSCGNVSIAEKGSDLEKRCIERASKGFFDALHVKSNECPHCKEEEERRVARMIDYDFDNRQFNSRVA